MDAIRGSTPADYGSTCPLGRRSGSDFGVEKFLDGLQYGVRISASVLVIGVNVTCRELSHIIPMPGIV